MDINNIIQKSVTDWNKANELIEIGESATSYIEAYLESKLPSNDYNRLIYVIGRIGNLSSYKFLSSNLQRFYKEKQLCLSLLDSVGNLPLKDLDLEYRAEFIRLLTTILLFYKDDLEVSSSIIFVLDNFYSNHPFKSIKKYKDYRFDEVISLLEKELNSIEGNK